jgi:hypothetical protein
MIKSVSATSDITHKSLLTYSTWLVIGVWLIFTGAVLIYNTSNGDSSFFSYLFGAIRIWVGGRALKFARSITDKSNQPQALFLRCLTLLLLLLMVCLPLLVFILQTSFMLFGTYQPNESYMQNAKRLIIISVCYLLATIFAGWRLRK